MQFLLQPLFRLSRNASDVKKQALRDKQGNGFERGTVTRICLVTNPTTKM